MAFLVPSKNYKYIYNKKWNTILARGLYGTRYTTLHSTFFYHGTTALSGSRPPQYRGFMVIDTPQSVGPLWTSDQPIAETSTWQNTTLTTDKHPCPPAGFEPTIPARERPQTHALDRAATGTGLHSIEPRKNETNLFIIYTKQT